jgi:uncharacterized protein (TIGR02246 family)
MAQLCASADDEAALRKVISDYAAAWSQHDPKALSKIFAEDADFVGGSGGLIKGRAAFEKIMAEEHATVFKSYTLKTTVDQIRFLKPDIALIDGAYEATHAHDDSANRFVGMFTLVMRKIGRDWLCLAMRSIGR